MDTTQHDSTQLNNSLQRPWRGAFVAALRQTGNVRRACEACGINRTSAYNLRNADPTFAAEWDDAQEDFSDLLEEEAVRRAMGTKELVIHQGKLCGTWRDKDGNPTGLKFQDTRKHGKIWTTPNDAEGRMLADKIDFRLSELAHKLEEAPGKTPF